VVATLYRIIISAAVTPLAFLLAATPAGAATQPVPTRLTVRLECRENPRTDGTYGAVYRWALAEVSGDRRVKAVYYVMRHGWRREGRVFIPADGTAIVTTTPAREFRAVYPNGLGKTVAVKARPSCPSDPHR